MSEAGGPSGEDVKKEEREGGEDRPRAEAWRRRGEEAEDGERCASCQDLGRGALGESAMLSKVDLGRGVSGEAAMPSEVEERCFSRSHAFLQRGRSRMVRLAGRASECTSLRVRVSQDVDAHSSVGVLIPELSAR